MGWLRSLPSWTWGQLFWCSNYSEFEIYRDAWWSWKNAHLLCNFFFRKSARLSNSQEKARIRDSFRNLLDLFLADWQLFFRLQKTVCLDCSSPLVFRKTVGCPQLDERPKFPWQIAYLKGDRAILGDLEAGKPDKESSFLSKVTRRGTEKWKASLKRWLQYPAKRLCCLRDYELHGFLQGTLSDWPIVCSHSNSNWKHTQSVTWPVFNLGEQRAFQSSVRHIYWKPTVFQVQWWIRCLTWKLWAAGALHGTHVS